MELMKIKEENGKQLVSARELYQALRVKTQFKDWAFRKITSNVFFQVDEDYTRTINYKRAGQEALEFALTLDTAKKIAMFENNEAGNNVHDYFIAMEKKAKQQFQIPQTYSAALLLAAKQAEQIELQQKEIKTLEPKADFYDAVTESKDTIKEKLEIGMEVVLDKGHSHSSIVKILDIGILSGRLANVESLDGLDEWLVAYKRLSMKPLARSQRNKLK